MRHPIDGLLTVLLAPTCAVCARPLERPSQGPVCPACWAAVPIITPPVCERCGDPLPSWRVISQGLARCPRCRRQASSIACGRAVGVYEGTLREIVHAFKYDGRRTLAASLGRLMAEHGGAVLRGADVVVPVPLHRRRLRARGFNQAADLALTLGLPVVHALVRTRATPSQTDLPAAQRHRNVRDAFAPARRGWLRRNAPDVRGRVVVVIDDVTTTGATIEACARALTTAGAREVRALTVARVVLSRP